MPQPLRTIRPLPFVVVATPHGTMILSRYDFQQVRPGEAIGVGGQILESGSYEPAEASVLRQILKIRREHHGDGAMAVDCGANIGVHTVEMAKEMLTWGSVLSIEPQKYLFYALCGNITINNLFNVQPVWAVATEFTGIVPVPIANFMSPGSYGSLAIEKMPNDPGIGQNIDYDPTKCDPVQALSLDQLDFKRVDLIKIDVEGMEMKVLRGLQKTLARLSPVLWTEVLRTPLKEVQSFLDQFDYVHLGQMGENLLSVKKDDPALEGIRAFTSDLLDGKI